MNEQLATKRILIADDEPLYLRTTGQLLRKAGYDCECVPDANAALEKLRCEPFDLILSDLNMPGNLKLELLQQGRTQWPDIPLIVITGVPSLPTAIESVRLGIACHGALETRPLVGASNQASGLGWNRSNFVPFLRAERRGFLFLAEI